MTPRYRIACAIFLHVLAIDAFAQARLVPFQEFYKSVGDARFEDYAKTEGVKVGDAAEFRKMKAHIVSTYEGVKVRNSFSLGEREYVDCIDIHTQPGLRRDGKFVPLEKPPAPKIAGEGKVEKSREGRPVEPMLSRRSKDAAGNVQFCEEGFIPMRRLTLEDLVRYETLADFFNKYGKAGEKGLPTGK